MNSVNDLRRATHARGPLALSRSGVIKGTELYEGTLVDKFETGWHLHDGWQIVAVTHGERRYQFNAGTLVARPGHLVLLPPNLIHRAQCARQGETSFRIATLPPLAFQALEGAVPARLYNKELFDQFLLTYLSLQGEQSHEREADLLKNLEIILSVAASTRKNEKLRAPAFVVETRRHLLESLRHVTSLASLAARVCVSPYHLAHTFTKFVGLSPLAFHVRARLLESRALLAKGDSLIDVAHSLGFSDQSHFGRHFKSVYAMTPKEYRLSVASPSASTARSF